MWAFFTIKKSSLRTLARPLGTATNILALLHEVTNSPGWRAQRSNKVTPSGRRVNVSFNKGQSGKQAQVPSLIRVVYRESFCPAPQEGVTIVASLWTLLG